MYSDPTSWKIMQNMENATYMGAQTRKSEGPAAADVAARKRIRAPIFKTMDLRARLELSGKILQGFTRIHEGFTGIHEGFMNP